MLINIQNYGAIGDGANDDTAAIQAAFTAANAGDEIYVPSPSAYYSTSSPIVKNVNSIGIHGDGLASTLIVNNFGGNVFSLTGVGTVNIRDVSFAGAAPSMQTYIDLNGYQNVYLSNLYAGGNYRFINVAGSNFIMMSQVRGEMLGGSEAMRIQAGGGTMSNVFMRKSRVIDNVGPTVWMTGQVTSFNFSNCGFAGLGTPFKSILGSIVNAGTSFTCTMSSGSPHNFGVAGEIVVIAGTGTAYDGRWIISNVLSNMSFTVTATTGLGNYSGIASCYKPECTLYMSNAGAGAVNETNWSNIIFESIDAKSAGSFSIYLDTIPGGFAVADHSFSNCLYDSGESFMLLAGKGALGQFINNINSVGGLVRYSRDLVYNLGNVAANVNIHDIISQTPLSPMGYIL